MPIDMPSTYRDISEVDENDIRGLLLCGFTVREVQHILKVRYNQLKYFIKRNGGIQTIIADAVEERGTEVPHYCETIRYKFRNDISMGRMVVRELRGSRSRPNHMCAVIDLTTGYVYRSESECAAELGIDRRTVSACVNGRQKLCRGHELAFYVADI